MLVDDPPNPFYGAGCLKRPLHMELISECKGGLLYKAGCLCCTEMGRSMVRLHSCENQGWAGDKAATSLDPM